MLHHCLPLVVPAFGGGLTPGYTFDLDPRYNVDVTTEGAACGSLIDGLSGAAFVQATAGKKPTYKTNLYNGMPALRFVNANSTNLTTAAAAPVLNALDQTIIVVAKSLIDNNGTNGRVLANFSSNGGTSTEGYHISIQGASPNNFICTSGEGTGASQSTAIGSALTASGAHVACIVLDHTTPTEIPYYDGVQATAATVAYVRQTTAPAVVSIGSANGTGNYADMDFIRAVAWPFILSAAQVVQSMAALKALYGTP